MNGECKNANQYPNTDYARMINDVIELRISYETAKDYDTRKKIAKEEFAKWTEYLEARKNKLRDTALNKEHWIQSAELAILKEAFDRTKHRDTGRVESHKVIDMHSKIARAYPFKVPIHPKNLSQIVHPHHGYMAAFPNRSFSWDEFIGLYEAMMVSSYEKTKGRYLHGEELAALGYYML